MPNHCETDVYITGPRDDALEFAGWIRNNGEIRDICLELIPYPEPYKTMDAEYAALGPVRQEDRKETVQAYMAKYDQKGPYPRDGYNSGGYTWCIAYWGTKRGTYCQEFCLKTPRGMRLSFQSAWAPPNNEVFGLLSKKFPRLTFEIEYFEQGAAYCGGMTFLAQAKARPRGIAFGRPCRTWEKPYDGPRGG